MTINMSYAEMAFLRDMVNKKKFDLWRTVWLPSLKDKSSKAIDATYKKVMNNPVVWRDFPGQQLPLANQMIPGPVPSDMNCCNFLLERFRRKEEELQRSIRRDK